MRAAPRSRARPCPRRYASASAARRQTRTRPSMTRIARMTSGFSSSASRVSRSGLAKAPIASASSPSGGSARRMAVRRLPRERCPSPGHSAESSAATCRLVRSGRWMVVPRWRDHSCRVTARAGARALGALSAAADCTCRDKPSEPRNSSYPFRTAPAARAGARTRASGRSCRCTASMHGSTGRSRPSW